MIYANKSADLQQEQEGRRANSKTGRNLSIATCFNAFLSRGDKIRTCDHTPPRRVLYRAELHPELRVQK